MSLESVFRLSLIMNMVDNITGPMGRISSSVNGGVSRLQKLESAFGGMVKTGAVMTELGSSIAGAALAPVEATFETRRALGELASLGVKDLEAVEDAARSFSDQWAGTSKADFISASYDIKSGIASLTDEGVADFTTLAALTGKATKSTVGEMTSLFATGYGIYKGFYDDLTDLEFGEMFSAGISKSVQQFKTTGSEMAAAIESLGASATNAKVPLEEQLSVLGMLQATMSGSEAGTKYAAFIQSAAKGGEELGLAFVDANNQIKSLPEILDLLRGKYGDTIDAIEKQEIATAFGTDEAVDLIDLLYSKTGELQDNVLSLYDAMGQGTAVASEMASAMNETEPEKFERLQQQLHNVAEAAGSTLLPVVNDLMEGAAGVIQKGAEWVENHQNLVRIILLAALTLGGFLAVAGTCIAVVGGVGIVFTKTAGLVKGFIGVIRGLPDLFETIALYGMEAGDAIRNGFNRIRTAGSTAVTAVKNVTLRIAGMAKTAVVSGVTALKNMALGLVSMARQAVVTAVTAMPGLIASVWSFTAALLANPITWVVIGIVALIAALILLWQNWDSVTAFLQNAWDTACSKITAGLEWLKQGFQSIMDWIGEKIAWFGEAGRRLVTTFVDGIKSVAMAPINAVKGIFGKISNLFPHSDAKEGPLSTLTLSGKKTMTTFAEGVTLAEDAPANAITKGLEGARVSLQQDAPKPVRLGGSTGEEADAGDGSGSAGRDGKVFIVKKLVLQVDVKKIKQLQDLLEIVGELEDKINSGEDPDDDPETDFALA
ncbi:MAG: phage tail tape measure protein [Dysosmobacter welbionis]|uniref:phage tail tape measure protein n=1 Tax=Dysosmobacter welbionis TaxID=2093857 RepID=UPI003990ED78